MERCVEQRCTESFGSVGSAAAERARYAAECVRREVVPRIRSFLATDIDVQRTTPLTLVREAVPYATGALRDLGAPPVARDRYLEERFPDDVYALTPANLTALGDECAQRAIEWGAAKAFEHRRRHGGA